MAKFQQGGVSVYEPLNLPAPNVGDINTVQDISVPVMSPVEVAALANLTQTLDQRNKAAELARAKDQQAIASTRKEFLAMADGVAGPVHNDYQKAIIDEAKAKYGIADNIMETMDLNNLQGLQQETQKLYRFWHDPKVISVLGEVEAANKYMDKLPINMTPEETAKWWEAKTAYENYTMDDFLKYGKPFDVRMLDGRMYQQKDPAAVAAAEDKTTVRNLFGATAKMMGNGAVEVDWTDPQAVTEFADAIASGWVLVDPKAEDAGYVFFDDLGQPHATEKGKALAVAQGQMLNQSYGDLRQNKLEDREAGKQIDSRYRAPRSSSSGTSGSFNQDDANHRAVNDGWNQIMAHSDLDQAFGDLDPFSDPALFNYVLSLVPAISQKTGEPGGRQVITINSETKKAIRRTLQEFKDRKNASSTPAAAPAQSSGFSSPTLGARQLQTPTPNTSGQSGTGKWVQQPDGSWKQQ